MALPAGGRNRRQLPSLDLEAERAIEAAVLNIELGGEAVELLRHRDCIGDGAPLRAAGPRAVYLAALAHLETVGRAAYDWQIVVRTLGDQPADVQAHLGELALRQLDLRAIVAVGRYLRAIHEGSLTPPGQGVAEDVRAQFGAERSDEPALPEPPAFPVAALPGPMARWVAFVHESQGLPLDYLACYGLAALSIAVGGRSAAVFRPGWSRRAILWVGIIGWSGDRKSPALAYMRWPIDGYLDELRARHDTARQEYGAAYAAWKDAPRDERGEAPTPPARKVVLLGNQTIEGLWDVLAGPDHGGTLGLDGAAGMGILADELRAVIEGLGAYKNGTNPDRAHFLELHAGKGLAIFRKKGALEVRDPTVSLGGGMQPDVVRVLTGVADGLSERFLLSKPWSQGPVLLAGRSFDEQRYELLRTDYGAILMTLLHDHGRAREVPMSAAAKLAFMAAHDRWEEARQASDMPRELRGFLAKCPDHLLSAALVLAEGRRAAERRPIEDAEIGEADVSAAAEVVDYFIGHRPHVPMQEYNLMAGSRQVAEAERAAGQLMEALTRAPGGRLTRRQMARQRVGGHLKPAQLDAMLTEYEAEHPGCVVTEGSRSDGRGGSPTQVAYHPSRKPAQAPADHRHQPPASLSPLSPLSPLGEVEKAPDGATRIQDSSSSRVLAADFRPATGATGATGATETGPVVPVAEEAGRDDPAGWLDAVPDELLDQVRAGDVGPDDDQDQEASDDGDDDGPAPAAGPDGPAGDGGGAQGPPGGGGPGGGGAAAEGPGAAGDDVGGSRGAAPPGTGLESPVAGGVAGGPGGGPGPGDRPQGGRDDRERDADGPAGGAVDGPAGGGGEPDRPAAAADRGADGPDQEAQRPAAAGGAAGLEDAGGAVPVRGVDAPPCRRGETPGGWACCSTHMILLTNAGRCPRTGDIPADALPAQTAEARQKPQQERRPYTPGGPNHSRPWAPPPGAGPQAPSGRRPPAHWRPGGRRQEGDRAPDPAATIAALGPDGQLLGRARVDRVEPGAHMLRDALGAVASAGGRQLELAGRPSEWLGAPTATKGRRRVEAPGVRDWPALEAAKAAGWTFTYYDLASGERVSGIGAWTDARHSELTGDRWLTLHIPEIEPTVRAMLDLDAGELLDAMQSASRALGRRVQEWEGRGFKELVGKLRPDADAVLTATELPPASEQETDPEWSREVADDEWDGARLWVFDRSASYLRGMDSVVGCGELERLDAAGAALAAREKKLRPGSWLVRLTGPDPLAARDLPPVLDVTDRATWIPASTLALLRDLGGAYEVLGAALRTEVQTAFWDPVAKRMTEARDALLARGDDPAARVALEIVKRTYTAGLQQLDRTAGEVGQPWMRPDVHAGIVQHARALAVRAAASAKVRPVAYVAKDSMAWLLPASIDSPAAAAAAIGLRYGRRPGLWHESLTLPGEEVRAMLMAREPAGDLGGLRERARVARAARAGQSVSAGVPRTLARVVYGLVMGAKRNA